MEKKMIDSFLLTEKRKRGELPSFWKRKEDIY